METTALAPHSGDGSTQALARPADSPAPSAGALQIRTLDDLSRLSGVLAQSGYFKDAKGAAQAAVKVLYGAEIGIGPVQAMMNVHVIEGKPAPGAGLVAALIKRSGKYSYRVHRHEADGCEIEFFELVGGQMESIGVSTFDQADAKRAGLLGRGPWKSYPKAMMFARAVTQGARTFCPDVFGGAVYDPEELGGPEGSHEPSPDRGAKRPASFKGESIYTDGVEEVEEIQDVEAEVVDDEPAGDPAQLNLEAQAEDYRAVGVKLAKSILAASAEDIAGVTERARLTISNWPDELQGPGEVRYVSKALKKRAEWVAQVEAYAENGADSFRQGEDPGEIAAEVKRLTSEWPEWWREHAIAELDAALKEASGQDAGQESEVSS